MLATADDDSLAAVLRLYGGVVRARAVAREVVERRYLLQRIATMEALREVLEAAHRRDAGLWEGREEARQANIRRAFLALRRFVNDEVNELVLAVRAAEVLLQPGEALLILCFSVKRFALRTIGGFKPFLKSDFPSRLIRRTPHLPDALGV